MKANCILKIRKDRVYHVCMALSKGSYDVAHAECGCPAGVGPHGSYKHIDVTVYWHMLWLIFASLRHYQNFRLALSSCSSGTAPGDVV